MVAPGESVVHRLVEVAPESSATAVSVRQRAGRVVAWLVDHPSRGSPWTEVLVPPTASPGQKLVVAGLPTGGADPADDASPETGLDGTEDAGGAVTLAVAVPGEADARVDVTLVTEQGQVAPAGMQGRLFTAGSVERVSLRPPGGASFAVVVTVTSGSPVTVAVGVPGAAGG
nr:DUF5719 family protein [Micromonospora sp. DSM 115978]